MKRILSTISLGLLGALFALLMQAAIVRFIDHSMHQFESGSDEAGEPYLKNLLIGVPLFAAIWGWAGYVLSENRRKGILMIGGIFVGALVCFGLPGRHGPLADIFNFSGSTAGLVVWAIVSWLFAFAARSLDRRHGLPSQKNRTHNPIPLNDLQPHLPKQTRLKI